MSLLWHVPKTVLDGKRVVPTTGSILLMSVAIFLTIILVIHMAYMFTESSKNVNATCRDKIVRFEQRGMYVNADQFKLALSYCGIS